MGCHCGEPEPLCTHQKQELKKTRTFPGGVVPPFLPQPQDDYEVQKSEKDTDSMLGPWAFGRVMWTPTADITGIRPIVDRYTITRYSGKDWRKKNMDVLDMAINTDKLKENVKCTIDKLVSGADKHQSQNSIRLEDRLNIVRACRDEIEQLVKDLRDEIVLLTEVKIRLKFALPGLKMPESIAGECIDRRTARLEQDLVNDEVEIEVVKELCMIKDIRDKILSMLERTDKQILACKAIKEQLEITWSDKKETCEIDALNVCLRNTSPTIAYYGGAARIPHNQSSPESWGIYNMTLINAGKDELKTARELREISEEKILNAAVQELRNQADKVYKLLLNRIEETDLCREMFEKELQDILRQITEAESQYDGLLKMQRQLQFNTKVAQTRLNNRQKRPKVENCRDEALYGLLDECNYLSTTHGDLRRQIEEVDKVVSELYKVRSNLEYAITTKRKSLYVDQQLCLAYRDKYPDASVITGGLP